MENNNEAASALAYDLQDGLFKFVELAIAELFTGPKEKATRSDLRNLAKSFNPAYWQVKQAEAASASQSSTAGAAKGGDTCPLGCTGPDQGGSGCAAVTGDCAMDSPATAAEGVDTDKFRRLLEDFGAARWGDVEITRNRLKAYITTYGAQQREAGRRDRDAEVAEMRATALRVATCAGAFAKDAIALARQPVSEGLTGSRIEKADTILWCGVTKQFVQVVKHHPNFKEQVSASFAHKNALRFYDAADIAEVVAELDILRVKALSAVPPAKAEGLTDGVALIAAERCRQVEKEGWSAEHDDKHDDGSLPMAAALYAAPEPLYTVQKDANSVTWADPWPWHDKVHGARGGWHKVPAWDKRKTHPRLRQLAIAGALIAAEIDRLGRAEVLAQQAKKGGQ